MAIKTERPTLGIKKERPMLDPIAYREDYPEEAIIGGKANESFNQFGDDSDLAHQQQSLGGLSEKYEGEGTFNYNKDANIKDLPSYVYGRDTSKQPNGYITQRNDNIASALYNEGVTSKDAIVSYLASQEGWNNSSEMDRINTVEAIWKRMGQLGETPKEEKKEEEVDTSKMESDLNKSSNDVIYGKTTADSGNPEEGIKVNNDANLAYNIVNEERIAKVNTLLNTPISSIAAALETNAISGDMQAIVDYKAWYPELWAEVEKKRKEIRGQLTVDAITKGEEIPVTSNTVSTANNSTANFAAENATEDDSMADIMKDIHNIIASNQSASSASETMANIENEVSELNERLRNLRKEANNIFKGDTPDYIVNAYINNRTQEIQSRLNVLSDNYKFASNRYDKEVANAQWEKDYSLKERQVKVQEDAQALNEWKERNGVTTTTTNTTVNSNPTTSTSLNGRELPMTTKTRSEIGGIVDNLVDMYNKGQLGNAQCGVGIQTYYLPQLGISFGTISLYGEKLGIRNEGRDYMPQKGDLIIMASGTAPKAGHIGLVIGITEDGKIQYLDWNGLNGKKEEEPAIREIDPNSAKISGYYNATKGFSNGGEGETSWNQWTDYDYTRFEQYRDTTSKTEKEAIASEYGTNVQGMNNIVREALTNRKEGGSIDNIDELTWVDYVGLTEDQLAEIEKQIGYNPNIEWELKKIIDKGIPTSGPAMQNVLKTVRAKDEKQLGQWIDHYQNKVNAEAISAGEDILLLLAQLQNAYDDEDAVKEVTKDGKTKTIFDTNAMQGRGWGAIGIKYNQLIKQLLLNKVTEAREKGATFGQMTEYEWKILEDAASALKIKFAYGSSDESFSTAFFDLVNATWKLTNGTNTGPTREEWNNYVNQVKNESEWYMTSADGSYGIDGSNLGGGSAGGNTESNDSTMGILFGTGA